METVICRVCGDEVGTVERPHEVMLNKRFGEIIINPPGDDSKVETFFFCAKHFREKVATLRG